MSASNTYTMKSFFSWDILCSESADIVNEVSGLV